MLDVQTVEHGYVECYTPYIVNREVLEGTGSCPSSRRTCSG
jgi:seryl-tRNA synthetase